MPRNSSSIPNVSFNWKPLRKSLIDSKVSNESKVRTNQSIHRSNSQRRRNDSKDEMSEECYQTICLGNITSNQFKNTFYSSSQSQDWLCLEDSILQVFNRSGPVLLGTDTLCVIHEHVRNLLNSNIGSFVYDRYKSQMLRKGMEILRQKINGKSNLIEGLCDNWVQFYSNILPALDCILFKVKAKSGLTIRQTTLIAFRDEIIFKTGFEEQLNGLVAEKKAIPQDIKHMLLVLQSIYECYPPTKNKTHIESLTALVISPYMAYKGLYIDHNNVEPAVLSIEPHLNAKRKSIDLLSRSVSRPLTMQPKQLETLNELFASAIRKMS